MSRNPRLVALAAGTAIIALQTAPALAEGTSAGTTITNTATINYRVGTVDQTAVVASDSFDVDRKINLVVTRVSDPTTTVVPGQTDAVIAFDVTNLSNAAIDAGLVTSDLDGGISNIRIYRDDGDNVFDAGDALITSLDEVAEDATVRVFVVSDVALSQTNGDIARVQLEATAREGGTPGSQGAVVTASTGPDTDNVETVLADGAGVNDAARDGVHSAEGSYTASAATLNVVKSSRVLSDPVNAATNPKAIPGATIEYCIAVFNGPGSATATDIVVTDVVPADLTFDGTYGIRVNGTVDGGGACLDDGVAGGSLTGSTVTAPLSNVAANQTRTAYFRATIN